MGIQVDTLIWVFSFRFDTRVSWGGRRLRELRPGCWNHSLIQNKGLFVCWFLLLSDIFQFWILPIHGKNASKHDHRMKNDSSSCFHTPTLYSWSICPVNLGTLLCSCCSWEAKMMGCCYSKFWLCFSWSGRYSYREDKLCIPRSWWLHRMKKK